jgi:uncharacterized membrane protein
METVAAGGVAATRRPQRFDLSSGQRIALATGGGIVTIFALYAVIRGLLGVAAPVTAAREIALTIHLATVIPAMPLGAYVLLQRKGGPHHRLLGRIWLGLMFTTAVSTIFIRHINDGNFSFIHIFTLMTFMAIPRAIITARQGRIDEHKWQLVGVYIGALVVAGLLSFMPGRLMWHWAFG